MALLNTGGGGFRLSTPPIPFNLASGWTLHITFMGTVAPGNGPFGAGSSIFEANGGATIRVLWDSTNTARRGSVVMYSNFTDGIVQIPNLTLHKWYEVTAGHDGTYFWVTVNGVTTRMVKDPFSSSDVTGLTLFNATDGYYSFENGKVARAALWNQSLSPAEVAYLQNGGQTQAVRRGAQMANWDRLLTPTRAIDYTGRGNDMDQPYGSFAVTNGPAYEPRRVIAGVSAGTTYNETLTDSVTGAESFASALTSGNTVSDSVTAAESNASAQTMPEALADDVAAAEAMASQADYVDATSDGVTASDSVTGDVIATYNETISDGVTASDVMEGELPSFGDTHDGFKRRSRRQRAMDAAEARAREEWQAERNAIRLSLEASMGMAAEVVEDAPAEAVAVVQEAVREARAVAPALRAPAVDLAPLQAALARLNEAVEAAARAKALADDDEEVLMLLRAL